MSKTCKPLLDNCSGKIIFRTCNLLLGNCKGRKINQTYSFLLEICRKEINFWDLQPHFWGFTKGKELYSRTCSPLLETYSDNIIFRTCYLRLRTCKGKRNDEIWINKTQNLFLLTQNSKNIKESRRFSLSN